jgi:dihydrofolate synthase/folylpolyglutamate synthase
MNYPETLDYIFHKLPMFSRMGSAAYKKDLHNIRVLCEYLGNPHYSFKTIHIAGTNGKGSVSHMLAAIFQTAGYKTGLYTSPHLYDFRERIRLDGQPVPQEFVVDFVEYMRPVIEEIEPSFFEITVAMAFRYYAEQEVDMAIIEVGLGGRLDSTNIITPELSVITNIGWDHMNLLGNSLEEIAGEKAGIIKHNVPVVIGETRPETKPVFQRMIAEQQAPVTWAEELLEVETKELQASGLNIQFRRKDGSSLDVQTDLAGTYQVQNVRTVLAAVDALLDANWRLDEQDVLAALRQVKRKTGLMGRWEVIQQYPMVVLEVAHNEDGIRSMMEHVQMLQHENLHLVIGMVKDKEVEKVLSLLPKTASYYFTQAAIPRALPSLELQAKAATLDLHGEAFENVNLALKLARFFAQPDDLIIVCGSIFLVAEVKR